MEQEAGSVYANDCPGYAWAWTCRNRLATAPTGTREGAYAPQKADSNVKEQPPGVRESSERRALTGGVSHIRMHKSIACMVF